MPITIQFACSIGNDILLGRCDKGHIEATFLMKFVDSRIISLDDDIAVSNKEILIKLILKETQTPSGTQGILFNYEINSIVRLKILKISL